MVALFSILFYTEYLKKKKKKNRDCKIEKWYYKGTEKDKLNKFFKSLMFEWFIITF